MKLEIYDINDVKFDINEKDISTGKELGRYILPDKIIGRMKKLVERSDEINKEIGFKLCVDRDMLHEDKIPISTGMTCMGEEDCIRTFSHERSECPSNKIHIGGFHTHPNAKSIHMSAGDAITAYVLGLGCIGIQKEVSCFVKKRDDENIYLKLRYLSEEEDKDIRKIKQYEERTGRSISGEKRKFFSEHFQETNIP